MRWLPWFLLVVTLGCGSTPETDAGSRDGGSSPDAEAAPPPRIETSLGPVVGRRSDGVLSFRGIPFAEPPVGSLRWRPPRRPEPWAEPLDATLKPGRCAQRALGLQLPSSEDCLYLNVDAPDPLPDGAPVLVWIHGGAFIFGEGLQTDDGTAGDILARDHGLVVVSMNYRLGAFGFLAHPDLSAEGSGTNFGLLDQRAALEWVRDEISAFGGDPDNVTLMGESAGGLSVCLHMASPGSQGLFHRAISQSGLCGGTLSDGASAEARGEMVATTLGCSDAEDVLDCMRSVETSALLGTGEAGDSLLASLGSESWFPSVDGVIVPDQFEVLARGGAIADVPTVIGWNADEGTLFVFLAEQQGVVADEAAYEEVVSSLATTYARDPAAIRTQYPLEDYPDPGAAAAAAVGHASLACPSRRAARWLAAEGREVRTYFFTYPDAGFQLPSPRPLGAFHSAEIQYVFGHPAQVGLRAFRGDDAELHAAMAGYWARFAAGSEAPDGTPDWPLYDLTEERYLGLDREVTVGQAADREACALWDPPEQGG